MKKTKVFIMKNNLITVIKKMKILKTVTQKVHQKVLTIFTVLEHPVLIKIKENIN